MTIQLGTQRYQNDQSDELIKALKENYLSRTVTLVCSDDMKPDEIEQWILKLKSLPCLIRLSQYGIIAGSTEAFYFENTRRQFKETMKHEIRVAKTGETAKAPTSKAPTSKAHKSKLYLFTNQKNTKLVAQQQQQQQQQQAREQRTTQVKPVESKERPVNKPHYVNPPDNTTLITREKIEKNEHIDEFLKVYEEAIKGDPNPPTLLGIFDQLMGVDCRYIDDKRKTLTAVKSDALIQVIRHYSEFKDSLLLDDLPIAKNEEGEITERFRIEETGYALFNSTRAPLELSEEEAITLLGGHVGYIQYQNTIYLVDQIGKLEVVQEERAKVIRPRINQLKNMDELSLVSAHETGDEVQRVLCYATKLEPAEKYETPFTICLSKQTFQPNKLAFTTYYAPNTDEQAQFTKNFNNIQDAACTDKDAKTAFQFFQNRYPADTDQNITNRITALEKKANNKKNIQLDANFYRGLTALLIAADKDGVNVFLKYLDDLKDVELINYFLKDPDNYVQWSSKEGFENLKRLSSNKAGDTDFTSAQQNWWKTFVKQHAGAGARVDFNDLFRMFDAFLTRVDAAKQLDETCPFQNGHLHMKTSLGRLDYILSQTAPNNPNERNEQFNYLKQIDAAAPNRIEHLDLGPTGVQFAMRYEGEHLAAVGMHLRFKDGLLFDKNTKKTKFSFEIPSAQQFAHLMQLNQYYLKGCVVQDPVSKTWIEKEPIAFQLDDIRAFYYCYVKQQSPTFPFENYVQMVETIGKKNLPTKQEASLLYTVAMASTGKRGCVDRPQNPTDQLPAFLVALNRFANSIQRSTDQSGTGFEEALTLLHDDAFDKATYPTLSELTTLLNHMPADNPELAKASLTSSLNLIKSYGNTAHIIFKNHDDREKYQSKSGSKIKPQAFDKLVTILMRIDENKANFSFLNNPPENLHRVLTLISLMADPMNDIKAYMGDIDQLLLKFQTLPPVVCRTLLTELVEINLEASKGLPTFASLTELLGNVEQAKLTTGCDLVCVIEDKVFENGKLESIWNENGQKPIICKKIIKNFVGLSTGAEYYFYSKSNTGQWMRSLSYPEKDVPRVASLFTDVKQPTVRLYDYQHKDLYDFIKKNNLHQDMTIHDEQFSAREMKEVMLTSLTKTETIHGKKEFEGSSFDLVSIMQQFVRNNKLYDARGLLIRNLSGMIGESRAKEAPKYCDQLFKACEELCDLLLDEEHAPKQQVEAQRLLEKIAALDEVMKALLKGYGYIIYLIPGLQQHIIKYVGDRMPEKYLLLNDALPNFFEKKTLKVFLQALCVIECEKPLRASMGVLQISKDFKDYLLGQLTLDTSDHSSIDSAVGKYGRDLARLNQFINQLGLLQNQDNQEFLKCVDLLSDPSHQQLLRFERLTSLFDALLKQKKLPLSEQLKTLFDVIQSSGKPGRKISETMNQLDFITDCINTLSNLQDSLPANLIRLLFRKSLEYHLNQSAAKAAYPIEKLAQLQQADKKTFEQFVAVINIIGKYVDDSVVNEVILTTVSLLEARLGSTPLLSTYLSQLLKQIEALEQEKVVDKSVFEKELQVYQQLLAKIPADQTEANQWLKILIALSQTRPKAPTLSQLKKVADLLTTDVTAHSVPTSGGYEEKPEQLLVDKLTMVSALFDVPPYPSVGAFTDILGKDLKQIQQDIIQLDLRPYDRKKETEILKGFDLDMESISRVVHGMTQYLDNQRLSEDIQFELIRELVYVNALGRDEPLIHVEGGKPVQYWLRKRSRADLKSLAQQLMKETKETKDPNTQKTLELELLAVMRELYCRSTFINPNSTQLLSVLLARHNLASDKPSNLLLQIDTGEGKSVTTALLAALRCAKGRTVIVPTANHNLVMQDYYEQQNDCFFEALGMRSAVIGLDSPPGTFKVGGINYGAFGYLSTYRSNAKIEGESLTRDANRNFYQTDVVYDEGDTILDDQTQYKLSVKKDGIGDLYQNPKEWMYYAILEFMATSVGFQRLEDEGDEEAWDHDKDITELKKYLEAVATTPEQKEQVSVLTRDDLSVWLVSAAEALNLDIGRDYDILDETITKTIGGAEVTFSVATPISSSGVPQRGASFLEGRHQFIQAFLEGRHQFLQAFNDAAAKPATPKFQSILKKREAVKGKKFVVEAETMCVATESPDTFLSDFLDKEEGGTIIALTGTAGVKDERLALYHKYNLLPFMIPPHRLNRRDPLPEQVIENRYQDSGYEIAEYKGPPLKKGVIYVGRKTGSDKIAYWVHTPSGLVAEKLTDIQAPSNFNAGELRTLKQKVLERATRNGHVYRATKLDKMIIRAIEQHADVAQGKRQPILVIAKDINHARAQYAALVAKYGDDKVQLITGMESAKDLEALKTIKTDRILVGTPLLGRGKDFKAINDDEEGTTHENGLFVIQSFLDTPRNTRQYMGRAARKGEKGKYVAIYAEPGFKFPTYACLKFKRSMTEAERLDQIEALQQALNEHAAIELYCTQEIDDIQQVLLRQFDAWMKVILADNNPDRLEYKLDILLLRAKLIQAIDRAWAERRQSADSKLSPDALNTLLEAFEHDEDVGVLSLWKKTQAELIKIKQKIPKLSSLEAARFQYLEQDNLQESLKIRVLRFKKERVEASRTRSLTEAETRQLTKFASNKAGAILHFDKEKLSREENSYQARYPEAKLETNQSELLKLTERFVKQGITDLYEALPWISPKETQNDSIEVRFKGLVSNILAEVNAGASDKIFKFHSPIIQCIRLYEAVRVDLVFDKETVEQIKTLETICMDRIAGALAKDLKTQLAWSVEPNNFFKNWFEQAAVTEAASAIYQLAQKLKENDAAIAAIEQRLNDGEIGESVTVNKQQLIEERQTLISELYQCLTHHQVVLGRLYYYFPFGEYFFGLKDTKKVIAQAMERSACLVKAGLCQEKAYVDSSELGRCDAYLKEFTRELDTLYAPSEGIERLKEILKQKDGLAVIDELLHYLKTSKPAILVKPSVLGTVSRFFTSKATTGVERLTKQLTAIKTSIQRDDPEVEPVRGRLFLANKENSIKKALKLSKDVNLRIHAGHTGFDTTSDMTIEGKALSAAWHAGFATTFDVTIEGKDLGAIQAILSPMVSKKVKVIYDPKREAYQKELDQIERDILKNKTQVRALQEKEKGFDKFDKDAIDLADSYIKNEPLIKDSLEPLKELSKILAKFESVLFMMTEELGTAKQALMDLKSRQSQLSSFFQTYFTDLGLSREAKTKKQQELLSIEKDILERVKEITALNPEISKINEFHNQLKPAEFRLTQLEIQKLEKTEQALENQKTIVTERLNQSPEPRLLVRFNNLDDFLDFEMNLKSGTMDTGVTASNTTPNENSTNSGLLNRS